MKKEMEKIRKEERDNFTIVLENLQSDFKMFGEALSGVNENLSNSLDGVERKIDMNFEEIGNIKIELNEVNGRLDNIEDRLGNIEKEIKSIRQDFDLIKEELQQKVGIDYIKGIEKRLEKVERHLELKTV